MQVGWSDIMNPPSEVSDIPPALFAVEINDQLEDRRRRLDNTDEAIFKSRKEENYEMYMKIVQAIEVNVESESEEDI